MLKGEAKKDYQREYMRQYMRDLRLKSRLLRPLGLNDVKTPIVAPVKLDADGNLIPDYD